MENMKRGKRGQVTLFVVIAIVVVSAIALLLIIKPGITGLKMSEEEAKRFLAPKIEELRLFTAECVEKISFDFFTNVTMHGGYYNHENLKRIVYADGKKVFVAYRTPSGFVSILPSLEQICGNLFDVYMEKEGYAMLDKCTDNFKSFKKVMGIEEGARDITAECREEDILINVEWSITASKADVSLDVKPKGIKLLIPLKRMWVVANDIVNSEVSGYNFIGEEIEDYLYRNGHKLEYMRIESTAYPTHEQTLFFIITEPYRKGEEISRFYFAVDRAEI